MANKQGRGGGARKIGRMKAWCKQYVTMGTLAKNKRKRIARHVREAHLKQEKLHKRVRQGKPVPNRFYRLHYWEVSSDQT